MRDARQAAADLAYDVASDAAASALQAEEDAAQAAFDAASQVAWDATQPSEAAAESTYDQIEAAAWAMYESGLATLNTQWQTAEDAVDATLSTAQSDALTAWHTAEATAWDEYTTDLAALTDPPPPGARIMVPTLGETDAPPEDTGDLLPPDEGDVPGNPDGTFFTSADPTPLITTPELYADEADGANWGDQSPVLSLPDWQWPDSAYYAHTLDEAKYRAWVMARNAVGTTGSATPVGDTVAAEFGVSATMAWGDFFPWSEYNAFIQSRQQTAADLDPVLIAALDADWRIARQAAGYSDWSMIGDDVAARWISVPGFEWATGPTTWMELYTRQAYDRLNSLRATPIPIVGDPPGNVDSYPDADYRRRTYYTSVVHNELIPRWRIATETEKASYLAAIHTSRNKLLIGLSAEMSWASAQLASATLDPLDRARATEYLNIANGIFAELYHTSTASDYGIFDSNAPSFAATVTSFQAAVAGQADPLSVQPMMDWNNYRATVSQRVAFLADTTYETFVLRERVLIHHVSVLLQSARVLPAEMAPLRESRPPSNIMPPDKSCLA